MSAPYNQFSLPLAHKQDITICTYFKAHLAPPKEITLFEGDESLMGFFRVLKAALAERKYDIVHAHTPHVGFLYLVASIIYRKSTASTVYSVHDSYQNYKFRNKLLFLPVFAFFKRVVCCGEASLESFPALFRWLAGDRLCAVQNGLDIARVDRVVGKNQELIQKGDFTVVAIGRLVKIKNLFAALSAFQQSDSQASRLVFIGDGRLRDLLMKTIKESGLGKRIELAGLIPRDKVYEYLTKADLFISASRGEGLPIAVLEAMACRCPVLLSDIAPHREIVDGADFVPLVHPDDVVGFAQEIKRFRQMSPSERVEIGEKCRGLVEERFSLSAMHKGYEEVYAQVLDKY
jgi:glycosyltransferase involved in cell wall biosynthesis